MSQHMQEPFKRVSVAEAKQLIAGGVQVVDVRTPADPLVARADADMYRAKRARPDRRGRRHEVSTSDA